MDDGTNLENLDLEERRRRNIERNQKYFAQLFATLSQVNNLEPTPNKKHGESEEDESNQEKDKTEELENLIALFPSFKDQVFRISSFMDALILKVIITFFPLVI